MPISTIINIENIKLWYTCMMCQRIKQIYMYGRSSENTNFHVKPIALTEGSVGHMSNRYRCVVQSEKNKHD